MRLVVAYKCIKFRDPGLYLCPEMSPEAVRYGIFDRFSSVDNFRPEGASDVISGVIVDPASMGDPVKFGDSKSNRSRDIRLPHFVTDAERQHRRTPVITQGQNAILAFGLKIGDAVIGR